MKKDNLKKFETFLMNSGAQVLPATNEWELVRFRCDKGTGVIYKNKRGDLTFCGPAEEAHRAFNIGMPWSCIDKKKRTQRKIVMDELLARDGDTCFFCGEKFDEDGNPNSDRSATLEHLLAIANGGNNNINNLVLAHQDCNYKAARLSLIEKVKLRESLMKVD